MALIFIIEGLLEVLIEIVVEIFVQVIGELLVELGVRGFGKLTSGRKSNPVVAAIGYVLLGLGLGALSVWLWPQALMADDLRVINLIVSPLLAGGMMALVGLIVRRRGKNTIRLESFFYGWLFAFSMSLVRFLVAA